MTRKSDLTSRVQQLERRANIQSTDRRQRTPAWLRRIIAGRSTADDWRKFHQDQLQIDGERHVDYLKRIEEGAVSRLYARWASDPAYQIIEPPDVVAEMISLSASDAALADLRHVLQELCDIGPFPEEEDRRSWYRAALANVLKAWLAMEGEEVLRLRVFRRTREWIAWQGETHDRERAEWLKILPPIFPGQFRTDPDTGRITARPTRRRYWPSPPLFRGTAHEGRDPREAQPFPNRANPFRALAETPPGAAQMR